jgi:cardiolipin synthase
VHKAGGPPAPLREYVHHKENLRPGNVVEPLRCGVEVFPAMLAAIARAERYVHLETYILKDDRVGRAFQAALLERARAGVRVRVLVDALGSFELPDEFVDELAAGGVEFAEFHPIAPWRPRRGFNQRDHMKILVVDGAVGFTGGINLGEEYDALESGGGGWFDMHARVRGPVVADLDTLFRRTWERATDERLLPDPTQPDLPEPPHMLATVIDNFGITNRSRKRAAYLHAIRAARSRICLMNAYFLPDFRLRMALRAAVARGVHVEVIVPEVSDVHVVQLASRHLYPGLLRGGVHILEWPERMMHAKTGVIDGTWSTVGSYNIDRRSLFHNLEASVVVADATFGAHMQRIFDEERAKSREVTLAECLRRSWPERTRQWFCHLWRDWL